MRRFVGRWVSGLLFACCCMAETGVIIPAGKDAPDASILAIESMDVRIVIDNGHATVSLKQVFQNKTPGVLEGTFKVALPGDAAVSDFAVWDDLTRIPGVILERKRARELYNDIRAQAIDPGLLESGEVSEDTAVGEAQHSTEFSVKIVPIPPYGYKRVETEYRQTAPLTQMASDFVFPLKASGDAVRVPHLSVSVEVRDAQAISEFENVSSTYPLKVTVQKANVVTANLSQDDAELTSDLELRYLLANEKAPQVTSYREGNGADEEPGYFEASAILQTPRTAARAGRNAENVLVLFDTSLSMQWEKLERSFQALEGTLRALQPGDRFNVLLFNSHVNSFAPQPVAATGENVAKALDFVRGSKLRGGTNLQEALKTALAQSAVDTYLVLLSDGDMTEGTIAPAKLAGWVESAWGATAVERRPHIYALAIGDDADIRFLRRLCGRAGVFEQVNSTEPLEFKLANFVRKLGLAPLDQVTLAVSPQPKTTLVYRVGQDNFPGSRAAWVGEYWKPAEARVTVAAGSGSTGVQQSAKVSFQATYTTKPYLPAALARARVDALLEKIDRDGEDKTTIEEIIRLARKYHFVTPYTSFLAAPRALLRPRLIRPGDPLLGVRTDSSVESVVALFPFGLTKPLRYLAHEDIWQTRFVAPDDLADGSHEVRLILRDRNGHVYREAKTFVIASHPPALRVQLSATRVRGGDRLKVRVRASQTTRTVTAQLYGAEPLSLRWADADKANTGVLSVPASLPAGRYSLHVTAEDMAHNVSHQEVPLEILP